MKFESKIRAWVEYSIECGMKFNRRQGDINYISDKLLALAKKTALECLPKGKWPELDNADEYSKGYRDGHNDTLSQAEQAIKEKL